MSANGVRTGRKKSGAINNALAKKVLIIGGAGHVGSALVPKLLELGFKVRVLDRLVFGAEALGKATRHRDFELVTGDFRDLNTVVHAMSGMDCVVHLGPALAAPEGVVDEQAIIDANLVTTRLIAACAKAVHAKRFIYASSCAVYGAQTESMSEESPLQPSSLFAKIKAESEKELRRLHSNKFRPTILRFGTVYGVGGRSRFDLVVNFLVAASKVPGKVTIGSVETSRPFVHVEDVANAIALALTARSEQVCGETFNLGSDDQHRTLNEVVAIIRRYAPHSGLQIENSSCERPQGQVVFCKISKLMGFKPAWTLEAGIKQIVDAIGHGTSDVISPSVPAAPHSLTEDMDLELISGGSPILESVSNRGMLH